MADNNQQWVQVIGTIAIHKARGVSVQPAGSTRVLLAMLVAAGPKGITLEDMAQSYWKGDRPSSWRIALRASIGHLQAQLPQGWRIATSTERATLQPGHGFVDAWRVESEGPFDVRPDWVNDGEPFSGITNVSLVDDAVARIERALPSMPAPFRLAPSTIDSVRSAQRVITLAPLMVCGQLATAAQRDDEVDITVVGDRGLLLPLGPFVVAFPELRRQVTIAQGFIEFDAVDRAWRVVANAIALAATTQRQRLHIANAHELDTASLSLTSLLLERGPMNRSSIIICADNTYRDLRWLDFVRRATTAGCRLVEPT